MRLAYRCGGGQKTSIKRHALHHACYIRSVGFFKSHITHKKVAKWLLVLAGYELCMGYMEIEASRAREKSFGDKASSAIVCADFSILRVPYSVWEKETRVQRRAPRGESRKADASKSSTGVAVNTNSMLSSWYPSPFYPAAST